MDAHAPLRGSRRHRQRLLPPLQRRGLVRHRPSYCRRWRQFSDEPRFPPPAASAEMSRPCENPWSLNGCSGRKTGHSENAWPTVGVGSGTAPPDQSREPPVTEIIGEDFARRVPFENASRAKYSEHSSLNYPKEIRLMS